MKKMFWVLKITLAAVLGVGLLHAQEWNWARAYGSGNTDQGMAMIQTPDSGFLVAGMTRSGAGQNDAFVMKLDLIGMPVWSRAYGGNSDDDARDLIRSSDGNYIFAGMTKSMGLGQSDAFVCKITPAGTVIWASAIGTATLNEAANAIYECSDGSMIIAGTQVVAARNEIMVAKLNPTGGLLWMRVLQGASNDEATAIVQASDGNYIVTGFTNSWGSGFDDAFILKFDQNGNLLWIRVFGGALPDRGYALANLADGGFVVGGMVESWGNGSRDFMITSFDVNGNWRWSNAVGAGQYDEAYGIDQLNDGGYALVGKSQSFGSAWYAFITRLDAGANLMWASVLGGANYEQANAVARTLDGGYCLAGQTNTWGFGGDDILAAKFVTSGQNCAGNIVPAGVIPFTPNITDINPTVSNTGAWQNINPVVTIINLNEFEICALYEEVDEEEAYTDRRLEFTGRQLVFWLTGTCPVTLSIYDPAGRVVMRPLDAALLGPGRHCLALDDLAPGVYFARLILGDGVFTCRLVTR